MMSVEKTIVIRGMAILMLLGAFGHHPYSYYQILRWFICGLTVYFCYFSYTKKQSIWAWLFGITAVLFNPIAPIYFARETWLLLNIISAIIIFISIFKIKVAQYGEK